MPKVKIAKIVNCSSEATSHPAANLLLLEPGKTTQWRNNDPSEESAEITLQLESPSKITNVNIGNWYSAKIEIHVNKSKDNSNNFEVLLPSQEFMNETESRNGVKFNAVRTFLASDFNPKVAKDDQWDLVKIICTQPYIKTETFGLAFIAIYTDKPKPKKNEESPSPIKPNPVMTKTSPKMIGKFKLREPSPDEEVSSGLGLLAKWKNEKKEDKMYTPPAKNSISKASSSTGKTVPDRNRTSLLYGDDSDEENKRVKHSAKKLKVAQEERKRKSDEDDSPVKRPKRSKGFDDFLKNNFIDDDEKEMPGTSKNVIKIKKKDPEVKPKTEIKKSPKAVETPKPIKIPLKPKAASKPKQTRPFKELFKNVTIVISGIQNPERANIRQKALDMGARYAPDWDTRSTHLICAFKNTPKFKEVKGKGKIVTKDWILDSHKHRKRLPWRRYALDDADQKLDESEEEIHEETTPKNDNVLAMYDLNYDIDDENDVYNRSTDDDNSRDANPVKQKLFEGKTFYMHANVLCDKSIAKHLEQVIPDQNGKIVKDLHGADYILTVDKMKSSELGVKGNILDPKWVFECIEIESLVPIRGFSMELN
uniref:CSON010937 protein n=1 Tax=Culicoides sonorensis TaxID=179676 RepID=A0A336MZK2_CULSO